MDKNYKPTRLQLKALEIKKNNPKMPMGQVMREAGYSELTSRNPKENLFVLKGTIKAMTE